MARCLSPKAPRSRPRSMPNTLPWPATLPAKFVAGGGFKFLPSGKVRANVTTGSLVIQEGAIYEGQLEMAGIELSAPRPHSRPRPAIASGQSRPGFSRTSAGRWHHLHSAAGKSGGALGIPGRRCHEQSGEMSPTLRSGQLGRSSGCSVARCTIASSLGVQLAVARGRATLRPASGMTLRACGTCRFYEPSGSLAPGMVPEPAALWTSGKSPGRCRDARL